jgi:hypothetical protein
LGHNDQHVSHATRHIAVLDSESVLHLVLPHFRYLFNIYKFEQPPFQVVSNLAGCSQDAEQGASGDNPIYSLPASVASQGSCPFQDCHIQGRRDHPVDTALLPISRKERERSGQLLFRVCWSSLRYSLQSIFNLLATHTFIVFRFPSPM